MEEKPLHAHLFSATVALLQLGVIGLLTYTNPPRTADVYYTMLRIVHDPTTNHTALDKETPVRVHMMRHISLTEPILVASLWIAGFILLTRYLTMHSEEGVIAGSFAVENEEVSQSPGMMLWNAAFVFVILSSHAVYFAMCLTPCSREYLVLSLLVGCTPLVLISMPRLFKSAEYQSMVHQQGTVVCGVPAHVLLLCVYTIYMLYAATGIEYDPARYRSQLVLYLASVDLIVLGTGHLWEAPPSINTVLNCRLIYAIITALNVVALVCWGGNLEPLYSK
jgi:hypothetical protein